MTRLIDGLNSRKQNGRNDYVQYLKQRLENFDNNNGEN